MSNCERPKFLYALQTYIRDITKDVDSEKKQQVMNNGKHQEFRSKDLLPFELNIELLMARNKENMKNEYLTFKDVTR
jgi:hypothetical protein